MHASCMKDQFEPRAGLIWY